MFNTISVECARCTIKFYNIILGLHFFFSIWGNEGGALQIQKLVHPSLRGKHVSN